MSGPGCLVRPDCRPSTGAEYADVVLRYAVPWARCGWLALLSVGQRSRGLRGERDWRLHVLLRRYDLGEDTWRGCRGAAGVARWRFCCDAGRRRGQQMVDQGNASVSVL